MLPKYKRLNLTQNFKWVVQGKRVEAANLTVYYRNGENTEAKVGVAIKRGDFKKAHERNIAKRLAFSAVTPLYPNLPNSTNLVIMPKSTILKMTREAIKSELSQIKEIFN